MLRYIVTGALLGALAFIALVCFANPAEAKSLGTGLHPECNITMPCTIPMASVKPTSSRESRRIASADRFRNVEFGGPLAPGETQRSFLRGAEVLGGRPAGCPRRFCGCGVSLKVFGRIIPRYNLAANWRDFMPATPGGGAVAWRPGHVLYVEAHVGGTSYQVYDPNSGGGKIRRHVRNLAGYRFVDPSSPIRRVAGL